MSEKPGFHLKAAVPITDLYASDCVDAFEKRTMTVDFNRLLHDSRPVDFSTADKTDYIVIRLSCVFIEPNTKSLGVIWRSDKDHNQNADVASVLVSSELIDTYSFVKQDHRLIINRHYPFTEKLGAYLGAFEIERNWWLACLRRQKDRRTRFWENRTSATTIGSTIAAEVLKKAAGV